MKRRGGWLLVVLALACAWPCAVVAAPPVATPAPFRVPSAAPEVEGLGRIVPSFILLVLVVGAGIYILKNGLPMRGARGAANRKLQIEEMRSLGGRQFLVVVEYGENKMLLGVTPGKIDYLCALEKSRSKDAMDFAALIPAETPPESAS